MSKSKSILFLAATLIFLTIIVSPTLAQQNLSIGMSPSYKKETVEEGKVYSEELVVWNLTSSPQTYDIVVRGFRQVENTPGTAIMLSEEEEVINAYSASKWITLSQNEITLTPNKNEKIYYKISIPQGVAKGEYNAIISLISRTTNKQNETSAATSLSSGLPILLKIGDNFLESAELLGFNTDKKIYEKPNTLFLTNLKNLGETHITPKGDISVTNIFNQEVARIPFNKDQQSILRGNSADYRTKWELNSLLNEDKKLVVGPMKAKAVITYRSIQPGFAVLTGETSFWIIPWKYILGLLLLIVIITIIIKLVKKKRNLQK